MATYAIGDIQGCFLTLRRLLRQVGYRSDRDRLWLVGDLVNRGPHSLETLRWAYDHRPTVVLGNHDLHLLGRAAGVRRAKPGDTLDELLSAHDSARLLAWLGKRPFVHHEARYLMVHAGLLPEWTVGDAKAAAREVERTLRGPAAEGLLAGLARGSKAHWSRRLPRRARNSLALAALTRLRYLHADGSIANGYSGPPFAAPRRLCPWFDYPGRRARDVTVICGHWAALGLRLRSNLLALDSGCVWGGRLTAVRLRDRRVYQERYADG
jgi:bis(5'-nucleosyl)-tetraphosphatase (symmetrical)